MTEIDSWHRGMFMETYTGRKFYPMDPHIDDVNPVDIAHALAMQCRYNGHVQRFYSVAEHCIHLSYAVSPENALWALLHDATEAYVGDMVRPLKIYMPDYVAAEDRVMEVIAEAFGLEGTTMPEEVKNADTQILLTERAALMGDSGNKWSITGDPLPVTIEAWDPEEAETRYLARLIDLLGERSLQERIANQPPYPKPLTRELEQGKNA